MANFLINWTCSSKSWWITGWEDWASSLRWDLQSNIWVCRKTGYQKTMMVCQHVSICIRNLVAHLSFKQAKIIRTMIYLVISPTISQLLRMVAKSCTNSSMVGYPSSHYIVPVFHRNPKRHPEGTIFVSQTRIYTWILYAVYLTIYLPIYPSISLYVCRCFFLSIYLSIYRSTYLSISLSLSLSISISLSLSLDDYSQYMENSKCSKPPTSNKHTIVYQI